MVFDALFHDFGYNRIKKEGFFMLEFILDKHILFVLMGVMTVLGNYQQTDRECYPEAYGACSRKYE